MDTKEERTEHDRDDQVINPAEPAATGDVLGISRVPAGGTGEIQPPPESTRGSSGSEDEGRITPLEDEANLGARDVVKNQRGQTGPETGGHGSTPQRSGATGMDIG